MLYYYISGMLGMTSSGSFTKNKNKWIVFTENEVKNYFGRPYGATRTGVFINTKKYF